MGESLNLQQMEKGSMESRPHGVEDILPSAYAFLRWILPSHELFNETEDYRVFPLKPKRLSDTDAYFV